ncbi:unnamed protein product, partial [Ectocarpus sp. 8 AP-2014]
AALDCSLDRPPFELKTARSWHPTTALYPFSLGAAVLIKRQGAEAAASSSGKRNPLRSSALSGSSVVLFPKVFFDFELHAATPHKGRERRTTLRPVDRIRTRMPTLHRIMEWSEQNNAHSKGVLARA